MRYACAISLCSVDGPIAERLFRCLTARGVLTFFYERTPLDHGYMLNQHADIYARALLRVYFVRERGFSQYYPSFELNCGRGQAGNLVVAVEENARFKVPNTHIYMFDDGWEWIAMDGGVDVRALAEVVVARLRATP